MCLKKTAYRSVPECATELDSFQEDGVRLLQAEVCPHATIEPHSAEAGDRDLLFSKWECLDHFEGVLKVQ